MLVSKHMKQKRDKDMILSLVIVCIGVGVVLGGSYLFREMSVENEDSNSEPIFTVDRETKNDEPIVVEENKKAVETLGGVDLYGGPVSEYLIKGSKVYFREEEISDDSLNFELIKGSLIPMKGFISYLYAKDTNSVYYEGKKLEDVIVDKFRPIENGRGSHNYGTDGEAVYFGSEPLLNADSKTFRILWGTMWEGCGSTEYGADATHVYFKNKIMLNADPASFEPLINGYGKDKRGYYKETEYIGPVLDSRELYCAYG